MNKPKIKPFIFLAIFFFIIGTIFSIVAGKLPSADRILENGGEEVNAIVLHIEDSENSSSTTVQISDSNSFYDGDIVKVNQYSSSLYIGQNTTVYYDGEELLLDAVSSMPVIFATIGKIIKWIGAFLLFIGIFKFIIFIAKVGFAGLVVGSVANEVHKQEQFNNQFYGNSQGTTMNPYNNQQYNNYENQQYDQYGNPYPQQYQQQAYHQNNSQYFETNQQQQNNNNNYYNN